MSWKRSGTPSKAKPKSSNPARRPRPPSLSRTNWPPRSRSPPAADGAGQALPRAVSGKSRRDRQADVNDQALRYAVLGFDHAAHRLDIAPRNRQADAEGSRPCIALRPLSARRKIALEDLVELRRRYARPLIDDLDMS